MSFTINAGVLAINVIPAVIVFMYAFLLPFVIRKTNFLSNARWHIRRFAPLYLIVGPPAITYFALCGYLSSTYLILAYPSAHSEIHNQSVDFIRQTSFFYGFYVIEWACSLIGAIGFSILFNWLGLRRVWYSILFFSLSISAVYRTAACRNVGTDQFQFQSGPDIQLEPAWIDALPVIGGFAAYFYLIRFKTRNPVETN